MKGGDTKSSKTMGNAVARSTMIPHKNKKWKKKTALSKHPRPTPAGKSTPASNEDASTSKSKKPWKKNTGRKSDGKRGGKPTAARK